MPDSKKPPNEPEDQKSREDGQPNQGQGQVQQQPQQPPQPRRDENSISFRHFLNPHSDVVPQSYRNQQRMARGAASLDLFDGPSKLPDFVQDHLAQQEGAVQSSSSLDLSNVRANREAQNSRTRPRRPLDPSSSALAQLRGAIGGEPSPSSSSTTPSTTLPDFLSDGPMLCEGSNSTTNERGSSVNNLGSSENLRIVQLERELTQQRRDFEALQQAFARSEERLEEANARGAYAEAKIAKLKAEMHSMKKKQLSEASNSIKRQNQNGESSSSHANESHDMDEVYNIARSSETLIRKLLEQIELLKSASSAPSSHQSNNESGDPSKKLSKN